jgi:glycosyltransferase involved in cell wall biosynthesis
MPSVSIIIPTCNRPQLLPRAVESARAAGTDVEIIVVDDASHDETAAVCARLSGIKYIRLERNQGVAGARNVGILAARRSLSLFWTTMICACLVHSIGRRARWRPLEERDSFAARCLSLTKIIDRPAQSRRRQKWMAMFSGNFWNSIFRSCR